MKNFILVLFLLSTFYVVSQNKKDALPSGKYRFVSSSGGFTGKGTGWLPNEKYVAEFTKKKNCFKLTSNGKTIAKDTYKITESITSGEQERSRLLDYKNSIDQKFFIKGDTLFLQDDVADGYNYVFVRKK